MYSMSQVPYSMLCGDSRRPNLLAIENKILYILELSVGYESNLYTNQHQSKASEVLG